MSEDSPQHDSPAAASSSRILTIEQAAELLGVRPKTVRALAAGGIIPAAKVGKPWRFDETLLREWLIAKSRENVKAPCAPSAPISLGDVRGVRPGSSLDARLDALLAEEPTVQGNVRLRGRRAARE